jgi:hypothetical protein
MRKSGVIALFRELRSVFIIMECSLGPFCCHFHSEESIGDVGFDESRTQARIVIVSSVATLLSELLDMKAQTNAFKLQTADSIGDTSRRPLSQMEQKHSCEQLPGQLEGDFTNPRLHLGV